MRNLLVFTLFTSLAAAAAPAPYDAFLASKVERPLTQVSLLSVRTQKLLDQSHISAVEPRLGVPTFLWALQLGQKPTYRSQGLSPEQAARRFLWTITELYRADPRQWAEAKITRVHDLHDGTAVIVTLQQDVRGVRVFRDEVKVIMTANLELVAVSGYLTPETRPLGAFNLKAESAVASSFQDLTGHGLSGSALKPLDLQFGYTRFTLAGEETPVRVKPVWYALPNGLEPAFYVELELSEGVGSTYWSYVVSARDGSVLSRHSLTQADSFTYRVWADATSPFLPLDGPQGNVPTPHPTGNTDSYNPPFVPTALITLEHGAISTNDPWLSPGSSATQGNNVMAYADLSAPNGYQVASDVMPNTSSTGTFDYTYDTALSPNANRTQQKAAVTQLFYNNNALHDWYYDIGFDEAAGNAQFTNYARGGYEGDPIKAEGQDYSGTDNANMSTPSDGASPRMQMYIFKGASYSLLSTPSGGLTVGEAQFGPTLFNTTAQVILAQDGAAPPTDACSAITNNVTGKIVLVDRGSCTFVSKAQAVEAAGGVGIVIVNNVAGSTPPGMSGTGTVTIPVFSVTQADGADLKNAVAAGPTSVTMVHGSTLDRDGTIDNSIVAHEWGHYIQNRLIGDGAGLNSNQSAGMGEGWSDFHSMLMQVKAEDVNVATNGQWQGVYAMAGYTSYATNTNGYYFGIRRVPYSTDFTKNALTFKHLTEGVHLPAVPTAWGASGNGNSEVHNVGEVWCTMLWEGYAALLNDTPRLTFATAQDRMRRYIVAGYKATPLLPTFIEARDAILSVAIANDVADYELLWRAFARRGLGMLAVAPDRDSQDNSDLVESFLVGNGVAITDVTLDDSVTPCDNDGVLDNDEVGKLTIAVKNIGMGTLANTTINVGTTTAGLSFTSPTTINLPPLPAFSSTTVSVQVKAQAVAGVQGSVFTISANDPSLAVPGPVVKEAQFRINYNVMPQAGTIDNVEAPATVWSATSSPNLASGADWRIFQSDATSHWWYGPDPTSPADTWLTSPSVQVSQNADFVVSFKTRFDFEVDPQTGEFYDGAVVEVRDAAAWVDVGAGAVPAYGGALSATGANPLRTRRAFVGKSPNYPAFVPQEINMGRTFAGKTVRFRFRIGSDDAVGFKGMEVDDIAFRGIVNAPFNRVVGDLNTCGTNRAPTLTVPADFSVPEATAVQLLATASDPDGQSVTITWTQVDGPDVQLQPDFSFTAPLVNLNTELNFEVTASDGIIEVGPLSVRVLVLDEGSAPVATLPPVADATSGEEVLMVGTGSDVDGNTLTYHWSQVNGPAVTLAGADTERVSFTAPQTKSDVVVGLQLIVNDGRFDSEPAVVQVVVRPVVVIPQGACGCTSGLSGGVMALLGLVALARRRRRV